MEMMVKSFAKKAIRIFIRNIFQRKIKSSLHYGKTIPTDTLSYKMIRGVQSVPHVRKWEQQFYTTYLDYPKKVDLFINTACQLRCSYCFIDKKKQNKDFSIEIILDLIDQSRNLGSHIIQLLGGEPTLHPQLDKMIAAIIEKRMIAVLYSNGVGLTRERLKNFLDFGENFALFFNFDHFNAYQKITKVDAYEKVKKTIVEAKTIGLNTGVFLTITKLNYPVIDDLFQICERIGIIPTVERYMPQRGRDEVNATLSINAEEWLDVCKKIKHVMQRSKRVPTAHLGRYLIGTGCPDYVDNMSVLPNGDVVPCPFASTSERVGNVHEQHLADIWRNLQEKRKFIRILPDECTGCHSAKICGGGCKTYTFYTHGRYDKKDPFCLDPSLPPFKW